MVETKHKAHCIYGSEREAEWIQVIFGNRFRFQNPLRQNHKYIKTLSEYLRINRDAFHSLVVFWGGCKFKTKMPNNVVNNLLYFIRYIKSKTETILTETQVTDTVEGLKALKENTTSKDIKRQKIVLKEVPGSGVNGMIS